MEQNTTKRREKSKLFYRRVENFMGNFITKVNFITKILCCLLRLDRAELEQMVRRTKKLMAMHQALNPKNDLARIYLSRK